MSDHVRIRGRLVGDQVEYDDARAVDDLFIVEIDGYPMYDRERDNEKFTAYSVKVLDGAGCQMFAAVHGILTVQLAKELGRTLLATMRATWEPQATPRT